MRLKGRSPLKHSVHKVCVPNLHIAHFQGVNPSGDEQFGAKFWDVIGVYLNPPDNAVVLCSDEKSQCQALQRSQPGLPLAQGHIRTVTHDYVSSGT